MRSFLGAAWTIAAAAVICAGVAACGASAPTTGTRAGATSASKSASVNTAAPSAQPGAAPVVGAAAFAGHGRLAFVSGDRLYVLDGTATGQQATLHLVAQGQVPGSPAWSADGQWLAFLIGTPADNGAVTSGALWLAGADGQGAHQVMANVSGFAWSPKADQLAVLCGDTIFTLQPGQAPRAVGGGPGLTGPPAWSPDGSMVAVSFIERNVQRGFTGGELAVLELGSSRVVTRDIAHSDSDALLVDGWWPDGQGLFAWQDLQDSASLAADGVKLGSYALGGGVKTLPSTLLHQSFAVPAWDGVTLVTGGDRYLWNAKTITQCSTAGGCSVAMNAGPAPVNLDPAWAPGSRPVMVFVHAAPETFPGFSQQVLNAWYATSQLWYWIGLGGNTFPMARAGTGVAAPTWSANGQDILYVRDNALWLIPFFTPAGTLATGPATEIVSSLFPGNWPSFYGYTAWQSQFAWQS